MKIHHPQHNGRTSQMQVAIYVRVSTLRQQKAQTIEQQLDRLQAHVATQGWSLADEHIFRDDGYSGAKLNRPGLDSLRDRAAMAEFELVLITTPDRLARKYVHQMLLLEELETHGCCVEFLDRPMSDDPHDQLVLQIRGAVAEYERALIADRMRRGRLAKLRAGQLLPWTKALYGYILDAEHPRDPARVQVNLVEAAIVRQIFAWYTDPEEKPSLYAMAKRLSDQGIPTPSGGQRWNVSSIREMLKNPAYTGTAYANRTRPVPARQRKSALLPIGPGASKRPTPEEEWIPIPVPAIVSQEQFDQAQTRLSLNQQMSRRNNTKHQYLLRGLVSCGQCKLSCTGRSSRPHYAYYICRGKTDALRAAQGQRCQSRFTPAQALDELVWQDLCYILTHPESITQALERAQSGAWLPQQLRARSKVLKQALAQLKRQEERLLKAYLAEVIDLAEFERKRHQIAQKHKALQTQWRQLETQTEKRIEVATIAASIEAFCQQVQEGLSQATFDQRRQLVELLIDRVIVDNDQVEIRYAIPTSKAGEKTRFCHLRTDYFDVPTLAIESEKVRQREGFTVSQGGEQVEVNGAKACFLQADVDQASRDGWGGQVRFTSIEWRRRPDHIHIQARV
jgi:site-specific DNA recombinase